MEIVILKINIYNFKNKNTDQDLLMRIIKKSFHQVKHSKIRIIELFAQIYLDIFLTNFPIGKILLKSYLVKTKDKKRQTNKRKLNQI